MRTLHSAFLAIALCAAGLAGCGDDANLDNAGSARMTLSLPNGSIVNTVSYSITGNGITPITGTIDVSSMGAKVSFLVSGIPAGTGYSVRLDATSTDGHTTCGGSAIFNVVAGQTTQVTVLLQCSGNTTGRVQVNGVFCPQLTSFSAAPLAVSVGATIDVASAALDLDPNDDATPTFAWTATAGSFVMPSAASTKYNCSAAGSQTLTIKVSAKSPTVDVTGCNDSNTVVVTCVPLSCGNGHVDPGEECDPPNGTSCDKNCLQVPICGNGVVEAPVGPYTPEQCDPPNGTTCSSTCQNIPIVCGNGIVQPGEQCDPPNGTTCDSSCHTIAAARCGDGIVQPGEDCEPPSSPATNFTPACDANCKFTGTSKCGTCEASKCDAFFGQPNAWGCAGFTGTQLTNCQALLSCIRTSHCAPTGDASPCYCGTANDTQCLGGAANGACKAQYEAAAGTTDVNVITGGFVDPATVFGRVDNEVTCDGDTTSTPSCTMVCPL